MTWNGLIPNATPDSIPKAFIANAAASAIVVAFTIYTDRRLEKVKRKRDLDGGLQLLIVLAIAVFASLASYGCLYLLVGYGSSMLAASSQPVPSK